MSRPRKHNVMAVFRAKISRITPIIFFFAVISGLYSSSVHAAHRVTVVNQLSSTSHYKQKFALCHSSIAEADPHTTITCFIVAEGSNSDQSPDLETLAYIQIIPATESTEAEDQSTTALTLPSTDEEATTIEMDDTSTTMLSPHNFDSTNPQQQATIEVQLVPHLPEHITAPQITSVAAAFLSVHCGNPNTQPPIIFNTHSPDGALEVIVDLNGKIIELERENKKLKESKKTKSSISQYAILRYGKTVVNYYIGHWHLSPISFGAASILANIIDTPVKESIAVYEDEPEKELGSKCLIDVLVNTQELIDDAERHGILPSRHNISTAMASKIVHDFTQKHSVVVRFKSTGKFLQLQSSCECQYCEATKQPAEHNLQGRMVDFIVQTDQLRRDLETLMAYEMDQKLPIKTVISAYYIKIDTPFQDNSTIPSCKKCPKHITVIQHLI